MNRWAGAAMAVLLVAACDDSAGPGNGGERELDPQLVAQGREIFRFDTFYESD